MHRGKTGKCPSSFFKYALQYSVMRYLQKVDKFAYLLNLRSHITYERNVNHDHVSKDS